MRVLIAVICLGTLSGCASWFNDGEGVFINPEDDYLEVAQTPPLQVPEDLRTIENTDPFPIPEISDAPNPRYFPDRPPLPDAIYANDNRDEVRVQRLGDRRWLVIPEDPTIAWPKIKQFFSENGIQVVYDMPDSGRLNTDWMKIEAKEYRDVVRTILRDAKDAENLNVGKDRFLIKVEQGLRSQTTEVHIRHENDSATLPVSDDLVSLDSLLSDVVAAESDLLNEVGAYIAAKVSEQTISKVAQQIGYTKKSELTRDDQGDPLLRFYLDYERAWATLGQALENADVEITNLDRDAGVFFVSIPQATLIGDEEKEGFFCRVTFSCKNKDVHDLEIRVDSKTDQVFEVTVQPGEETESIDPDLAQQVLVLIKEYAS